MTDATSKFEQSLDSLTDELLCSLMQMRSRLGDTPDEQDACDYLDFAIEELFDHRSGAGGAKPNILAAVESAKINIFAAHSIIQGRIRAAYVRACLSDRAKVGLTNET